MKTTDRLTRVPLLTWWMLVTACASLTPLESPDLTLVDLELTEATMFETTLQVRLRVANPNPDPLTFAGASFKLDLDGHRVGRGLTSETYVVPRLGSEVMEVTFHISNVSLLLRLKEILELKTLSYGVQGKLHLQHALGTRKLKVSSAGRFDLDASAPDSEPPKMPDPG